MHFIDTIFGPLPKISTIPTRPLVLGYNIKKGIAFRLYIDNYLRGAIGFDELFKFLIEEYFPRVAAILYYLLLAKSKFFVDEIEAIGFRISNGRVSLVERYKKKFRI